VHLNKRNKAAHNRAINTLLRHYKRVILDGGRAFARKSGPIKRTPDFLRELREQSIRRATYSIWEFSRRASHRRY
jgi:hypothetical protein